MKKLEYLFLCSCCILSLTILNGQDTLSLQNLTPLSHSFTINENQLVGNGAEFLRKEINTSQFTILGDYPNSPQISRFTNTLLPILKELNYKTMAVDIGPISTQIINQLPACNKDIPSAIKSLNNRYGFVEKDRIHLPMPVLSSQEEATYFSQALGLDWKLIGLNNDSWNGLQMLMDELHFNLSNEEKQLHNEAFKKANRDLTKLYSNRNGDLTAFVKAFKSNTSIQEFMSIASLIPENADIIASIKYSLEKCEQYADKAYFAKNRDRIPYEKQILKTQLAALSFDISKDKLLVKVNRRHAAKGFQPDGFYGFSNTLQEMAAYNGNKSIHIGFFKRYYKEDGQVKDEMDNNYYVRNRYRDVIQMGQKDEWTIIDLRPLIEGSYYSGKYTLTPWIESLMKQYDLIIIPPTDLPTTINHDFSTQ